MDLIYVDTFLLGRHFTVVQRIELHSDRIYLDAFDIIVLEENDRPHQVEAH
jgi:hypothetical protein